MMFEVIITVYLVSFHVVLLSGKKVEQCKPDLSCPYTKQEVCGSNGKTYLNGCMLLKARCNLGGNLYLSYSGPCETGLKCRRYCPLTYEPLCGTDGNTYANSCMLKHSNCLYQRAVEKDYDGKCSSTGKICGKSCSAEKSLICGSNGKTYENQCAFEKEKCRKYSSLVISYYGECRSCKRNCKQTHEPVCGTDGKTYTNECMLSMITCRNAKITLKYHDSCERCERTCPNIRRPICGSDGKTYTSECHLEKENCGRNKLQKISKMFDRRCDTGCRKHCSSTRNYICGSDGLTYHSVCHLQNYNCGREAVVQKAYDGRCLSISRIKDVCTTRPSSKVACRSKDKARRYFYNSATGRCEMFIYAGCGGNSNNFETRQNCEGTCVRTCRIRCTDEQIPVCGNDGKTYKNYCVLRRSSCWSWDKIVKVSDGGCPGLQCARSCTLNEKYVCGSDGVTYSNDCFLSIKTCETAGKVVKAYDDRCLSKMELCTKPVHIRRGCHKSYYTYNYKLYRCVQFRGCSGGANSFASRDICERSCKRQCNFNCPNLHSAVCGTDHKTYRNSCHLNLVSCKSWGKIQHAYNGVCGGQQN